MTRTKLGRALLALALTGDLTSTAFAASQHAHEGHGGRAIEMTLHQGQKWPTDKALRKGMTQIRAALASPLVQIHQGQLASVPFSKLAEQIKEQVDYVVTNCKLPEEADLQLHVVLTQVLDGIAAMKGEAGQEKGVVAIAQALNVYGEHFNHPGWKPLAH